MRVWIFLKLSYIISSLLNVDQHLIYLFNFCKVACAINTVYLTNPLWMSICILIEIGL